MAEVLRQRDVQWEQHKDIGRGWKLEYNWDKTEFKLAE